MVTLTEKQKTVYDFILSYRHEHQTLPSRQDIKRNLGFSSYNSVACHFAALVKKGWIEMTDKNNVGYYVVNLK